jgi:hypothetical protein
MFALWPGDWLNFSNFKLQRLVSWDNARLRKPATSQTQTLVAIAGHMRPLPELIDGLKLLEPFLTKYGFTLDKFENQKGSGGQFTTATYIKGNKKFVIGYRASIGELYYQCGKLTVGHPFYLEQLGHKDKMKFPDFQSDDKLQSFRHILQDFELIKKDFFEGDGTELNRISKIQDKVSKARNKESQAKYTDSFDLKIIRKARQEFKDKKYKDAINTYGTVNNKELLTDIDTKTLKIARERIGEATATNSMFAQWWRDIKF